MKVYRHKRQRTLSFKVTESIEQMLVKIRDKMHRESLSTVTKTDVVEEAIRLLAKKYLGKDTTC